MPIVHLPFDSSSEHSHNSDLNVTSVNGSEKEQESEDQEED
jgi:hypothetical protein